MATILVAGDYCPSYRKGAFKAKEDLISRKLVSLIKNADASFVNLECPLRSSPINIGKALFKQGPSLYGEHDELDIIKSIGFTGVTLANNHILDYGEPYLRDTIEELQERKIDHVGGGLTVAAASKVLYKNIGKLIIAFINCCEHEFSIANEIHGGANPLQTIQQYYQIQEAKGKADYVIMIIHGGVEHFQYPTPRMVETYRYFIDAGADAIINHHQHCPCGYEEYKKKPIFYGLGNFFFPWDGKKDSIWNFGYMVKLSLEGNHKVEYVIIPYRQCDGNYEVNLLEGDDLQSFNKMMNQLNDSLQDEKELRRKLKEFNQANNYLYKKMFEPYSGRLMNGLYRRGIAPSFMSKERVLALIDFLGCESHYERVMDYLNDKYNTIINE